MYRMERYEVNFYLIETWEIQTILGHGHVNGHTECCFIAVLLSRGRVSQSTRIEYRLVEIQSSLFCVCLWLDVNRPCE